MRFTWRLAVGTMTLALAGCGGASSYTCGDISSSSGKTRELGEAAAKEAGKPEAAGEAAFYANALCGGVLPDGSTLGGAGLTGLKPDDKPYKMVVDALRNP